MSSDETNAGIHKYCDFTSDNSSASCGKYIGQLNEEMGNIDIYNIYAPLCPEGGSKTKPGSTGSVSLQLIELILTCINCCIYVKSHKHTY